MSFIRVIAAAGLAGTVALATPALATHNHPLKAKKFDIDYVRAYAECTSGNYVYTHDAPIPFSACAPVPASSSLSFDPLTGFCETKGNVLVNSLKQATDLKLSSRCAGINDTNGPFSGQLEVISIVRVTDHSCSGNVCTVQDLPFPVPMRCGTDASPPLQPGKCLVKTSLNANVGPPNTVVPGAESNVETGQWKIYYSSDLFAINGFLLP